MSPEMMTMMIMEMMTTLKVPIMVMMTMLKVMTVMMTTLKVMMYIGTLFWRGSKQQVLIVCLGFGGYLVGRGRGRRSSPRASITKLIPITTCHQNICMDV